MNELFITLFIFPKKARHPVRQFLTIRLSDALLRGKFNWPFQMSSSQR